MKNIILLIGVALSFFSAQAQEILEQEVRIDAQNVSIETVLNELYETENISFSYGNLDLSKKVTMQYKGSLKGALDLLLKPLEIDYSELQGQIVLKSISGSKGSSFRQKVTGLILDSESQSPLYGATIMVVGSNPPIGATSDFDGYFELPEIGVGRYDFVVSYIGYESRTIPQILITSGKEKFLNVALTESLNAIDEVVVSATKNNGEAINDMATLSARSFTVEETQRYAAAVSDPARMAQSYAGVTNGGDDLSNEIIIRGNSAKGLSWRLEGVEIPSPNHYGDLGSGGGSISMISSTTLANSDFYTGAFPAEFGNALSGVFDLKLRNGNYEKREHHIMIGVLGIEAGTEGYFSKKSRASYLINYRYSTLGLIGKIVPTLGETVPSYQDISFKINVPTKNAGTFAIFGLGGANRNESTAVRDSSKWEFQEDNISYYENQQIGIVGASHKKIISDKSYMRSVVVASGDLYQDNYEYLNSQYESIPFDRTNFSSSRVTASILLHTKFSAQHSLRSGVIGHHNFYDYDFESQEVRGEWISFLQDKGNTQLYQAYSQWKYRIDEDWTLNTGTHFTYLALNKTWAIDPRLALEWQFKPNQKLGLAAGLHSKPEHTSTYFIERLDFTGAIQQPNRNLKMMKAFHAVGSYDLSFAKDFRLKLEGYYQHLYDIPVSVDPNSNFSLLNSSGIFSIIFMNETNGGALVSEGTGQNYGLDITLEKFFTKGCYFMTTASIFDSKFTTGAGVKAPTRYASNYVFNTLGGKEFKVGKEQKNVIGLNGKFNLTGGQRQTPIDLQASIASSNQVIEEGMLYRGRNAPYYRLDLGFSYKINARRATHAIMLDLQNATNRFNSSGSFYDETSQTIRTIEQNGIIPIFNYRVEFSFNN